MKEAKRVLRYLKRNPGQGILLSSNSNFQLYTYCDSDWDTCLLMRRSLTGYFITLGDSPILWKTKKQYMIFRSSAEAEYRSMATITSELVWIKSFLASLGAFLDNPIKLF